jgi:outer membrane protein TolC
MEGIRVTMNFTPSKLGNVSRFLFVASAFLSMAAQPDAPTSPTLTQLQTTNANKVTLEQCLQMGRERSPLLRAAAINLRSALIGQRALESGSRVINDFLERSMPFRREQSQAGIQAATAELMQTDYDIAYNITRNYYSVVFAKQQLRVADDLLLQMGVYLDFVKEALADGLRGITKNTEDVLKLYIAEAEGSRAKAEVGLLNAIAALRHEMNLPQDCMIDVVDTQIPEFKVKLEFETVLNHALCRRGEIMLANAGQEVIHLEVSAQNTARFRVRMPTAAAATDLHYKSLPAAAKDGPYRPDPLGIALPVYLVGTRDFRVSKANAYADRAETVLENTRNLIALETRTEFNRYLVAMQRVEETRRAANSGAELVNRTRADSNNRLTDEKLLTYEALATKALAAQNEARFDLLISLSSLERITAGGVKVHFPVRDP